MFFSRLLPVLTLFPSRVCVPGPQMATGHSVLFNDSAPLPLLSAVPPPPPHPILQRLAFMKQVHNSIINNAY
jgi:hypothetical protein